MKHKESLTVISILWIILITISFFWNYASAEREHGRIAFQTARSFFNLIVMTRQWNAMHGGVYVPVTNETRPNPYLKVPMREIYISKDLTLTLVNPAYMTRQISEIAQKQDITFHITSLNPIRPENKPSPDEKAALQAFENGTGEIGKFIRDDAKDVFFYMAPLTTKASCLKCHQEQGYQLGDIRGGIRITMPFAVSIPLNALLAGHLAIGLVGLLGIIAAGMRLQKAYNIIRKQAVTDSLTGIPNRRSFTERIATEFKRSLRDQVPLSVILLDVDTFKAYNDTYGHGRGDQCLQKVSRHIKDSLKRPSDFCARIGGEEFIVLLPETSLAGAVKVAEKIRKNIEQAKIEHKSAPVYGLVTASMGVASSENQKISSYEQLVKNADQALYQAKKKGRNRVVSFNNDK
jgi:diguanylate cyclase (GGDEF)-like protein